MRRVLLTGATGFIGRQAVAPLLELGYEVHATGVETEVGLETEAEGQVAWHRADLLAPGGAGNLIAAVQPSHLLHFAWYAAPGKYWTSPENLRWVGASLELLQAFAEHGGQRVVMAGSCAEYDWRYGSCSEQVTPLAPATLYGTCKHALQTMVSAYAVRAGLSAAWGRIFFLYGPHEHPTRLVASVIRALLRGEPAPTSHGAQVRDFLHVTDAGAAFVTLLNGDVTGPVNVASGQPISVRDLVYRIAAKLGRADLIELGALPTPANEPPLLVADVRRLRDEVGWRPRYDWDTGLDQTIAWWAAYDRDRSGREHR
jgi:nucleoside-diphosphate-sugar epimerase